LLLGLFSLLDLGSSLLFFGGLLKLSLLSLILCFGCVGFCCTGLFSSLTLLGSSGSLLTFSLGCDLFTGGGSFLLNEGDLLCALLLNLGNGSGVLHLHCRDLFLNGLDFRLDGLDLVLDLLSLLFLELSLLLGGVDLSSFLGVSVGLVLFGFV